MNFNGLELILVILRPWVYVYDLKWKTNKLDHSDITKSKMFADFRVANYFAQNILCKNANTNPISSSWANLKTNLETRAILLYLLNKLRCVLPLYSVVILSKKKIVYMVIFDVGQSNETSMKQILNEWKLLEYGLNMTYVKICKMACTPLPAKSAPIPSAPKSDLNQLSFSGYFFFSTYIL